MTKQELTRIIDDYAEASEAYGYADAQKDNGNIANCDAAEERLNKALETLVEALEEVMPNG